MHFDLLHPVLDILEALTLIDGICEHDAHCSPVVGLCNGLEFLLAGCVPNLKANFFLADGDGLDLEVNANGGEVRCHEVVLAELEEHVGFAHSTIADHE